MEATYTVDWAESKNEDWKIVTLTDEFNKTIKDVSVNRTSKKGEVFPNFDQIMPGAKITGTYWQSDAGKNYLFPPRAERPSLKGAIGTGMKKLVAEKNANIEKNMDKKEWGIMTSSTIRLATDVAIAEGNPSKENILKWREWFVANWDLDVTDKEPFPDKA